jgi:hypothetical protein
MAPFWLMMTGFLGLAWRSGHGAKTWPKGFGQQRPDCLAGLRGRELTNPFGGDAMLAPSSSRLRSRCPKLSNNIIQKGLAFGRD